MFHLLCLRVHNASIIHFPWSQRIALNQLLWHLTIILNHLICFVLLYSNYPFHGLDLWRVFWITRFMDSYRKFFSKNARFIRIRIQIPQPYLKPIGIQILDHLICFVLQCSYYPFHRFSLWRVVWITHFVNSYRKFVFHKCLVHKDSYMNPAAVLKTDWYPDSRSLDLFYTPVFKLPVSWIGFVRCGLNYPFCGFLS